MENVNAPNLSDPWGVFLVGAFLFAVILVSEYRRGGEPLRERKIWDEKGASWWLWLRGGKGRNQNSMIVGTAWIGLILMLLFAWMSAGSPGVDCLYQGLDCVPRSGG